MISYVSEDHNAVFCRVKWVMKMNLLQSSERSATAYLGTYSYMPEASNLPNEGSLTNFAPTGEKNETIK
jgi:hypothetical protein